MLNAEIPARRGHAVVIEAVWRLIFHERLRPTLEAHLWR